MNTIYNTDYFIAKFESIPESDWTTGRYCGDDGARCALGHCGERDFLSTDESKELRGLFLTGLGLSVAGVNDREIYRDETSPKQRILRALREIKAKEAA